MKMEFFLGKRDTLPRNHTGEKLNVSFHTGVPFRNVVVGTLPAGLFPRIVFGAAIAVGLLIGDLVVVVVVVVELLLNDLVVVVVSGAVSEQDPIEVNDRKR